MLSALTIITTPDVPLDYTAAYSPQIDTIWVEPEYRNDAGVMYHELGHHVYHECLAYEHPYWMQHDEHAFVNAWAEYVLGYDVPYYYVPWIDAQWMKWWMELRTFQWQPHHVR